MSWITRCPSCGTTYHVVPDQLKIAQGFLRCGQCQHAFDSAGLVVPWPDADLAVPDEPAAEGGNERLIIDDLLKQEDRSPSAQMVSAVTSFEQALSTFKPLPASPLQAEASAVSLGEPNQSETARPTQIKSRAWAAKWSVAALMLALALQWLWVERQMLMTTQPSAAKILQDVCRLLGCEMLPLQVRDGVVIENSNLSLQGEGLLLSWSVRNATTQPLQMPALELTLLNSQDKALVRRVFLVPELEAPFALAPGQIWDGQLRVTSEDGLPPSGYRLIGFYP